MTQIQVVADLPLKLHLKPVIDLTDNDRLYEFCQLNREIRIERTAEGDLLLMSPTGGETSRRNARLVYALEQWARTDASGVVFDSSGGFVLPNGAMRAPDVAWVRRSRLDSLTPAQKAKFLPLCPDFVIELRSPTDGLATLHEKMVEYLMSGLELGWLIDPESQTVFVYRPEQTVERIQRSATISGSPTLPDFSLDLTEIWIVDF